MSNEAIQQEAGRLTLAGIQAQVPKLIKRITDALKTKGLTVAKMVRIFSVLKRAVADIEAIVAEK